MTELKYASPHPRKSDISVLRICNIIKPRFLFYFYVENKYLADCPALPAAIVYRQYVTRFQCDVTVSSLFYHYSVFICFVCFALFCFFSFFKIYYSLYKGRCVYGLTVGQHCDYNTGASV